MIIIFEWKKKKSREEAYNTDHSRVVSHHSTTSAQRSLTSESGRDPVHSPWYDRRHGLHEQSALLCPAPGVEETRRTGDWGASVQLQCAAHAMLMVMGLHEFMLQCSALGAHLVELGER